jgi:hypothetical protein
MTINKYLAIAGLAAVSTAASAGQVDLTGVTGEYRTSDYGNQYKLQADLKVSDVDGFRFYGEVEAMQKHSNVRSGDTVNLTAGASLPLSVGKFSVAPYVQLGDKIQDRGEDTFYAGVGVKASVPVTGKWSAEAAYRKRFDLWGADQDEDRVSLLAKYDLSKRSVLSGGIHNYSGTTTDKRWAVAYTYKF